MQMAFHSFQEFILHFTDHFSVISLMPANKIPDYIYG